MIPPSRLLVPIDFSNPSLEALETAKFLAKRWRASLDLVYVQDLPLSLMGFGAQGEALGATALWRQMKEFRLWREEKLRRAAGDFPPARVRVHVIMGAPRDEIVAFARRHHDGLIVMGTHGHTGADKVLFGSVAEAVVRRARTPILTVHDRPRARRISRILVPCNMKPYADKALRHALELAKNLGAKVTVLYAAAEDLDTSLLILRRHVESLVGRKQAGKIKCRVELGDAKRVILEQAREGRFDLIVLSAHRKRFISRLVLGSTAENILRHSPVAVLSLPSSGG